MGEFFFVSALWLNHVRAVTLNSKFTAHSESDPSDQFEDSEKVGRTFAVKLTQIIDQQATSDPQSEFARVKQILLQNNVNMTLYQDYVQKKPPSQQ